MSNLLLGLHCHKQRQEKEGNPVYGRQIQILIDYVCLLIFFATGES